MVFNDIVNKLQELYPEQLETFDQLFDKEDWENAEDPDDGMHQDRLDFLEIVKIPDAASEALEENKIIPSQREGVTEEEHEAEEETFLLSTLLSSRFKQIAMIFGTEESLEELKTISSKILEETYVPMSELSEEFQKVLKATKL
tara:strand:+ start:462 stop:893 length:432 start_codon:yes stop_codon:yes gene_type:complete